MRPSRSFRRVFTPGGHPSPKVGRRVLAVAALALAFSLVNTAPALAQIRGPNPLTVPLFDWDVDIQPNANIEARDLQAAYRRGVRDLQEGNCRSASQKFAFVLDYVDDEPRLYYAAGTAARCARAFRAATGYYESTLEFDPDRDDATKFLGISYLALGDIESATDALGTLAVRREDCAGDCDPRLEASYRDLKKALETARRLARNDTE